MKPHQSDSDKLTCVNSSDILPCEYRLLSWQTSRSKLRKASSFVHAYNSVGSYFLCRLIRYFAHYDCQRWQCTDGTRMRVRACRLLWALACQSYTSSCSFRHWPFGSCPHLSH
jgi:hypothetical protein